MFTFPLGALTLVVAGVLSLAFVALGSDALQGFERVLSRRALRKGRCPACRLGPIQAGQVEGWCCRGCAAAFDADGTQRAPESVEAAEMSVA
jgi:ribosomal protein L37AE/L43A